MGTKQSPLRQMLRKRGIDEETGLKMSRISRQTWEILLGGGVTLPQIALQVGKYLHLTREETKQLGSPLDKRAWQLAKAPFKRIDADPEWYKRIAEEPDEYYDKYLDTGELTQVLLEKKIGMNEFYATHPDMRCVNSRLSAGRKKAIAKVAKELGVPMERLETTERCEIGRSKRYYRVHAEVLKELMYECCMSKEELGKKVFAPNGEVAEPVRRTKRLWETIEKGEPVTFALAAKIAKAVGAEVAEIAKATPR